MWESLLACLVHGGSAMLVVLEHPPPGIHRQLG